MKDTKEKLLQTATKMFAKHGIDGVSTRDLVKKSGVNLCSINYYFGTKQKLYEAVMDNVYEHIQQNFLGAVKEPKESSGLSPKEEVIQIIGNFFDFLCSNIVSDTQAELLVREMFNPTSVYDKFYSGGFEPVHKRITELIAKLWQLPSDDKQAVLQTHFLLGQALIFRIHKEALFRRLGIKKYSPELLLQIKRQLKQNCEAALTEGEPR